MEVRAPLAGTIVNLDIQVGASVQEDDEIIVLEAMKMETPLFAPCSGTVSAVHINAGDKVQENQLLATID